MAEAGLSPLKRAVGYVLFGSLVAGTAGLGAWQAQRYFWKVSLIDKRKEGLRLPPLSLERGLDEYQVGSEASSEHTKAFSNSSTNKTNREIVRRVNVRGEWLPDGPMLVGLRGPSRGMHGGVQTEGMNMNQQGYYVLALFKLADTGETIIVNRGWCPMKVALEHEYSKPQGEQELTAVIVNGERSTWFNPANDPEQGIMQWLELDLLGMWFEIVGHKLKRRPDDKFVLLDQLPTEAEVDEVARLDKENPMSSLLGREDTSLTWPRPKALEQFEHFNIAPAVHFVYAVTWFSLSVFGAFSAKRLLFNAVSPAQARNIARKAAADAARAKQSAK